MRYAVIVLLIGLALLLSNSTLADGLSRLGLFLVIAVGTALLIDAIRQHRGADR